MPGCPSQSKLVHQNQWQARRMTASCTKKSQWRGGRRRGRVPGAVRRRPRGAARRSCAGAGPLPRTGAQLAVRVSTGGLPLMGLTRGCLRASPGGRPRTVMFVNAGARLLCTSDGVCVIVYVQFSSVGAGVVWGVWFFSSFWLRHHRISFIHKRALYPPARILVGKVE
jgi:hypothetical protein